MSFSFLSFLDFFVTTITWCPSDFMATKTGDDCSFLICSNLFMGLLTWLKSNLQIKTWITGWVLLSFIQFVSLFISQSSLYFDYDSRGTRIRCSCFFSYSFHDHNHVLYLEQQSDPDLESMRKAMIDRVMGWKSKLGMKIHLDDMVSSWMTCFPIQDRRDCEV